MINPLLKNPAPDFAELVRVLRGQQEPKRVHLVELLIDAEVLKAISEQFLGGTWVPFAAHDDEAYWKQLVTLYYRLGYDFVPVSQWPLDWPGHPEVERQKTQDLAVLSRGQRSWANEGRGPISSWDDVEAFPWDRIQPDWSRYEIVARHLPDGMKMVVMTNFFEHVLESLLGFEGLFFMLYDEPDLVAWIFERWGQKIYEFYRTAVSMDGVGAIFHPDDLGFKTSTLLSPAMLRQHVLPWHKRFAALAHEQDKMYWYHACGNHYLPGIIDDFVNDVKIDALHSFEDVIMPITEFKATYGDQVAALGGVDMDKLCRLNEAELRACLRDILDRCTPGGRFALGSGNTIANYVPLRNYCVMLDEGRRW